MILKDFHSHISNAVFFSLQSDRELENFFPETMKTTSSFSWENNKHGSGYLGKNQYNHQHNAGTYADASRPSSSYLHDKKFRSKKKDQSWAEGKLYDDRNDTGYKYVQPKEKPVGIVTILNKGNANNKVQPSVPITISSETFETFSSDIPKKLLPSVSQSYEKEIITILKPNGLSTDVPPVILSRSKVDASSLSKSKPVIV